MVIRHNEAGSDKESSSIWLRTDLDTAYSTLTSHHLHTPSLDVGKRNFLINNALKLLSEALCALIEVQSVYHRNQIRIVGVLIESANDEVDEFRASSFCPLHNAQNGRHMGDRRCNRRDGNTQFE